jgi:16S rRNA (guanine966-N2)-methyltransferase
MRIITGKLKGRKIPIPDTGELRPTSDRTKEGIFGVIAARWFFDGCHVLDLFAGSGNLGFEAISRGVEHVVFVDRHTEHLKHIENLSHEFGVEKQVTTLLRTVEDYLNSSPISFDLIFSDPPYDYPYMYEMIGKILNNGWLNAEGWFILEHDKRHDFSDHSHCFHSKPYGRTTVSIFLAHPVDSE